MLPNITVLSVCSAHLSRDIKYFIKKSQCYHRNKTLKKIVLKSLGGLVVRTDFSVVKTIDKSVYYVFSSQFITDKYIQQLRILEKAINQYNDGSLDAEYIFYDDITETPDMQSCDVVKANSKTTEENMVITCRISSFWNEFLQQEHIDNKSIKKQTKNQYYCPDFIDWLKRFCLPTISLWTKIMQNKVKKSKSNEKFANLLIRTTVEETNNNAQADECFKIKKYSSRLNENMNIAEFLRLNFLDNLRTFRASAEAFMRKLASLKSKDKKKFSKEQQLCQNMLIGQDEESQITKKKKYKVLLVKMKGK